MSGIVFPEIVPPLHILADEIDYRCYEITMALPEEVIINPSGEVYELYSATGIGTLSACGLGQGIVRIAIKSENEDRIGWWQDYADAGSQLPIQQFETSSVDLEDCPDLPMLTILLRAVHEGYFEKMMAEQAATLPNIAERSKLAEGTRQNQHTLDVA